jgi:uncharacterized paraquat-inducible protein A
LILGVKRVVPHTAREEGYKYLRFFTISVQLLLGVERPMRWESEIMQTMIQNHTRGQALCPICTHTVPAEIDIKAKGKIARVTPGQRCTRCSASLDVAVVIEIPQAA